MAQYKVIVGNVGTVYTGSSKMKALEIYGEYVEQSASHYGRSGGEEVTLMADGEPIREHSQSHYDRNGFSSSDRNETISYGKKTIATRHLRRGWGVVRCGNEYVDRAVREAIFSMPNDALAGELRREITNRLEEDEE